MNLTYVLPCLLPLALTAGARAQSVPLEVLGSESAAMDVFGAALELEGGLLAVGAPQATFVGFSTAGPGSAHVFDVASCEETLTFFDPSGGGSGGTFGTPPNNLGIDVSLDGGRVAILKRNSVGSLSSGIYDTASGQLLVNLFNVLGEECELSGGVLLVENAFFTGVTAYDSATGAVLWSPPVSGSASLGLDGPHAVIAGGVGGASVTLNLYDALTGALVGPLPVPAESARGFGEQVAVEGGLAIVGGSEVGTDGLEHATAWIYDLTTLQVIQKLAPANTPESYAVGVALDGGRAAVGYNDLFATLVFPSSFGGASVFDLATGQELLSLFEPNSSGRVNFGWSLDLEGDVLAVAAPDTDTLSGTPGRVLLYSISQPVLQPANYCQAKLNSLGCTPSIGWTGASSLTSANPHALIATDVLSGVNGIIIYGVGGAAALPMGTGTMCVAKPYKRIAILNSGNGAPTSTCDGTLSVDMNALLQSGTIPGIAPGTAVFAQWYYRDRLSPDGTGQGFTDGLKLVVGP